MRFHKLFLPVLILGLLVTSVGCDSGDDDGESEAELFVDAWAAVGVRDDNGDQTSDLFQNISEFTVTFDNNDTYSLSVVFTDGSSPIQFSGATYSVDEGGDEITLVIPRTVTPTGVDLPLTFNYAFSNSNNTVELSNSAQVAAIGLIFGTSYEGTVTVTLQRR